MAMRSPCPSLARAGIDPAPVRGRPCGKAQPRARGARLAFGETGFPHSGVSPRARGTHPHVRLRAGRDRSIPAWVGEPPWGRVFVVLARVYPRTRGGTRSNLDGH